MSKKCNCEFRKQIAKTEKGEIIMECSKCGKLTKGFGSYIPTILG